MQLSRISIRNFKGTDRLVVAFGRSTRLIGKNGTGKSAVYDAFLWTLFGKDSQGRAKFGVRPVFTTDAEIGNAIPGLVTECSVTMDEVEYRRQLKEKTGGGYTTRCWIGGTESKTLDQYNAKVKTLIDGNVFRIVTDLRYFIDTIPWAERRPMLVSMAGEIPHPEGFAQLLKDCTGKTMAVYRKDIKDEIKRQEEQKDQIAPRLDELQRNIPRDHGEWANAEARRDGFKGIIHSLNESRNALSKTEGARQQILDSQNALQSKLFMRESELISDTSRIVDLLEEKRTLQTAENPDVATIEQINVDIGTKERAYANLAHAETSLQASLATCRTRYPLFKDEGVMPKVEDSCPVCGQDFPKSKRDEIQAKATKQHMASEQMRMAELKSIDDRGEELVGQINLNHQESDALALEKASLEHKGAELSEKIVKQKKERNARIEALNHFISQDPKTPPADDAAWRAIKKKLDAVTVGESVGEQIKAIDSQISDAGLEVEELNNILAHQDRITSDKSRVDELKQESKDLSQAIAKLEGKLAEISEYTQAESVSIEEAVNKKFKVVKWRLFERLLNGEIKECCEATLNGVPYSMGCSAGEKVQMGLDVVNTTMSRYKVDVPLFVDNAESYSGSYPDRQMVLLEQKPTQHNLDIQVSEPVGDHI